MRLGGPLFGDQADPDEWMALARRHGYTAVYCPVDSSAGPETIREYRNAAATNGVLIAEVGAWSNPISPDEAIRKTALDQCVRQLTLAEEIGARCCVNIAGSRGAQWDGPHPDNLSLDTFDLIVETTRAIIDAVKPARTFYTLETMPWVFPDSPTSYLALIHAIDRKQFAAHLDPVNLVSSPQLFYENGALLRECFEKLGPFIKSCHAKDVILRGQLTVRLDEVVPGQGGLDYGVYLHALSHLDPDTPVMLEHLSTPEEYNQAAEFIRATAGKEGLPLR